MSDIETRINNILDSVTEQFHAGAIGAAESVALTCLAHWILQEPKRWLQGIRTPELVTQSAKIDCSSNSLEIFRSLLRISQSKRNRELETLIEQTQTWWSVVSLHSIYKVSERPIMALVKWAQGKWPLELHERVLSPYEVLCLQSEGRRCVSVFWEPSKRHSIIANEKNAVDFTMHDLAHAERFFFDDFSREGQIEFYRELRKRYEGGEFEQALARDSIFKTGFEYLVSDMNTHPTHQKNYLQAIWVEHLERV